ncbi:MAG: D-glycero-alpha-D-manno-heptose-1,7-bisphosphate 7-phosphatase [Gaiellaceae bacterium]
MFLDRDGVLNETDLDERGVPHPPASLAELRIADGAMEACRSLRAAGYVLVVVTNQPDVARGTVERRTVDAINDHIRRRLEVDDVRVCFHDAPDGCDCRKPAPGLLTTACHDLGLDPTSSFMVGDRGVDIEAGRRAGCRSILIDRPYSAVDGAAPSFTTDSLLAAAAWILHDAASAEEEGA